MVVARERGQGSVWGKVRNLREGGERGRKVGGPQGLTPAWFCLLTPHPHEAHCSRGTGPIIWFVPRQIITQLV